MMIKKTVILKGVMTLFIVGLPFCSYSQSQRSASKSFDIGLAYTGDLFANIKGGNERGVRYLDDIDVDLTIGLESIDGFTNSTVYLYGLGNQGGSISELVGDAQGVDNIEAENSWRLYEAWFEHVFAPANTSVLLGLYDINSEFDVIRTGLLFINSSQGIGAAYGSSGVLGPSTFPYTSLAARVKFQTANGVTFKAAVLDGIPSKPGNTQGTKIVFRPKDGALLAAELVYNSGRNKTEPATSHTHAFLTRGVPPLDQFRFVLGGWYYTQPRAGWLDPDQRERGVYLTGESRLCREVQDASQGLAGFVRFGLDNGKINRFFAYTGAGLVYTGVFDKRDDDRLGLAIAMPLSSSDYQKTIKNNAFQPADYEMNVEATYMFVLSSSAQFQLDSQFVINPNTLQNRKNALVLGCRMVLSL